MGDVEDSREESFVVRVANSPVDAINSEGVPRFYSEHPRDTSIIAVSAQASVCPDRSWLVTIMYRPKFRVVGSLMGHCWIEQLRAS